MPVLEWLSLQQTGPLASFAAALSKKKMFQLGKTLFYKKVVMLLPCSKQQITRAHPTTSLLDQNYKCICGNFSLLSSL